MKKLIAIVSLLFIVFSCEDVIDVDLNEAEPRLVVEASINWFKGTTGNIQRIKLTESSPFFDNEIPPALGAVVKITDESNTVYDFIDTREDSGTYINDNFNPQINQKYVLTITYKGETYTAEETLKSTVPIDFVEQINEGGFTGNDIELKAYYTDPEAEENYYFFSFETPFSITPDLDVYDDEFTNGNQIFSYYSDEDLESGQEIIITNYGVSERFYEFMFILLQQGSDDGGGPFETQPATVKGNIVNQTNPDNFPFGYFRLSEVDQVIYTVQE